jgi:hypothetical protein
VVMAGDVLLNYVDEHIQTFICPAESLIGLAEPLFRRRLTLDKSPGDLDQAANRFVVRFECLVNSFDGLVNPLDAFRKLRLMLENELHSFFHLLLCPLETSPRSCRPKLLAKLFNGATIATKLFPVKLMNPSL